MIEPGELLVSIEVPALGPGQRGVFVKLGQRRAQAISIVHLAAVLGFDGDAVTRRQPGVGQCGADGGQRRPRPSGTSWAGRSTPPPSPRRPGSPRPSVTPIDDVRATAVYRSDEIEVMVRRALTSAARRARAGALARQPDLPLGPTSGPSPPVPAACHDDGDAGRVHHQRSGGGAAGAAGRPLLDWLRDEVGLTGTKEGCAEGECGACTVHLDGVAVLSCLVPAARAHGAEIDDHRGSGADGRTQRGSPLQQAFVDQFAVQCGFCIPGFLCPATGCSRSARRPTRDDAALGLSGNLCRCTGYYRFYEAVEQAAGR